MLRCGHPFTLTPLSHLEIGVPRVEPSHLEGDPVNATRSRTVSYSVCEDIQLQLAEKDEHFHDAFRLVHDSYCRAGLDDANEYGLRVTPYQLLETSQIFVATRASEVLCTLTLARDGELGLPMDAVYGDEIEARRALGIEIGEVTCLADRRLSPKRFFVLFCELSRLMAQFAKRQGIDEIWIACHPKHAALYERRLAFSRQGGLCDYPAVLGNPAVPLCADLTNLAETHPEVWERFFREPIDEAVLAPTRLPASRRDFYAEIAGTCVPRLGRIIADTLQFA